MTAPPPLQHLRAEGRHLLKWRRAAMSDQFSPKGIFIAGVVLATTGAVFGVWLGFKAWGL